MGSEDGRACRRMPSLPARCSHIAMMVLRDTDQPDGIEWLEPGREMDGDPAVRAQSAARAARRARALGGDREDLRCLAFDADARFHAPPTEAARAPEAIGLELGRALLESCVPPLPYRGGRVDLATAVGRRFIATVYALAPEVFEGRRQVEMADLLGITDRAWREQIAAVELILENRHEREPRCRASQAGAENGPPADARVLPEAPRTIEVPKEADGPSCVPYP